MIITQQRLQLVPNGNNGYNGNNVDMTYNGAILAPCSEIHACSDTPKNHLILVWWENHTARLVSQTTVKSTMDPYASSPVEKQTPTQLKILNLLKGITWFPDTGHSTKKGHEKDHPSLYKDFFVVIWKTFLCHLLT